MRTDDFARVEALFDEAVVLDAESRAAALDASCGDRPDLRDEVVALLDAHDRIGQSEPADNPEVDGYRIGPGTQLGAFRVLEQIGEGGMGEVYEAERTDGVFTQHVAIKIMRASLGDPDLLRRFKAERQILASLQHPNIVTLLDGGATPDGRAYLVMELVDGTELMRHCREGALSLNERLQLFRALCSAVQYAHQHGVVHRDLKPANILIGSDGVLKVLDFGVAKLLLRPSDGTETTRGMLPGPLTPNYASPEQVLGLPVTTASDGYALGVLLYELVTEVRPYNTQGLTLDRLINIVVHTEPQRPSAVPSHRHLRGDIDAIVLKAMSKEAANRYDSAGELGSDVGRFLDGAPVLARAPSAGYVLRRLAARNKTLVAVSALALVAIFTASGVALWQREVARREQERAEQRFREVRQLANALIFKIHDAVALLAGSTPVRRTIVDEALAYLERLERESGADDVTLRLELAAAYRQIAGILGDPQKPNLGDREGALRQYERARSIAASVVASNDSFEAIEALASADHLLSTLYSVKGDREKAAATAQEAVDLATRYEQRHQGDERAASLVALSNFRLAWTLDVKASIPVWQRTLAYYEDQLRKKPGLAPAQRNVALVSKYLGSAFNNAGSRDEGYPHFRRALELDEARLTADPGNRQAQFDAAISYSSMSDVREAEGDLGEATRLEERSLELRRRVADADPKDVQARERLAYGLGEVGQLHGKRGDMAKARSFALEAIRVQTDVLSVTGDRSGSRVLANAWFDLGMLEERAKRKDAACDAFGRAHQSYVTVTASLDPAEIQQMQDAGRKRSACR